LTSTNWFTGSFSPKGCNVVIDGPAVTVGSGTQFQQLKQEAASRKVMVVAGAFATVSVGGYISNGGHGELSAKYGLGADQVLEIELVNANGEIITANECQNQDYFWAMRGGGGSTYGVVLTYTLKAIPTVKTARYMGSVSGWDQLALLHQQWASIAMIGGAGYISGYPAKQQRSSWSVTLPNGTDQELRKVVDPIVNLFKGGRGIQDPSPTEVDDGVYTTYDTFNEADEAGSSARIAQAEAAAPFPGMGTNKILATWLWSQEATKDLAKVKAALQNAFDADTELLNDATMGIGTHSPPYIRGGGNAVNPAFRTAVMRPAAELQWKGYDLNLLAQKKADALRFGASLRELQPLGGTYANEVCICH
jgi:hypothetical protein